MQKISTETVRHVAKLARLELSDAEAKKFQKDMNDILSSFAELDKAKADAEPSFQPIPMKDVVRNDDAEKCLSQDDALSSTQHKEKGFFKGPRAV